MGHVLMRLWWGSRDRLELPDRKASSNMAPPPQAPGPSLKGVGCRGQRLRIWRHVKEAGWSHGSTGTPGSTPSESHSFLPSIQTLFTSTGAENPTRPQNRERKQ